MVRWMDGWIDDGRVGGWMDGQIDGWMSIPFREAVN